MNRSVDLAYILLRVGPREHLSGMVTGIWLSVTTNVIVNAAMDAAKVAFLWPGILGLIGCCVWHYYTASGQELMKEMDQRRSKGESNSDIAADTKDLLRQAGNAWVIWTSLTTSLVFAVANLAWLLYLV